MKFLMVCPIAMLVVSFVANSAEIRWTASGSVSGLSGSGFAGLASVGDPLEITMVYDSATTVAPRSFFNIGAAVYGEAWFHGAAELAITVKIGEKLWRGEMPTVPDGQAVMVTQCWEGGGSPDRFQVSLDTARGGDFPDFPYGGVESSRTLEVEFRDDQSPEGLSPWRRFASAMPFMIADCRLLILDFRFAATALQNQVKNQKSAIINRQSTAVSGITENRNMTLPSVRSGLWFLCANPVAYRSLSVFLLCKRP